MKSDLGKTGLRGRAMPSKTCHNDAARDICRVANDRRHLTSDMPIYGTQRVPVLLRHATLPPVVIVAKPLE